ncbi:hypothetical protein DB346_02690 [Verrucomicrobia bacterium LW23]|nr:hypothetical protein DB346_03965 [Verrucomicrobia bacterium LW23]PTY04356.1 hypothetical protein DB346_02690 [Verrucomicrobia bacterium LW23]
MNIDEALRDLDVRENQLRSHILQSSEYRNRFNRDIKRQILMLYISILIVMAFQSMYAWYSGTILEFREALMLGSCMFFTILNCVILIRTKSYLNTINDMWINPQEKTALEIIRIQRIELQERAKREASELRNQQPPLARAA